MGNLTNISGEALDVAALRRTVAPGETVEVVDELLDSPDLIWPASTWQVNGAAHQHDPDSPENVAKVEAERQAEQEAADKAAQEAADVPSQPAPPLGADMVSSLIPEAHDVPAPAAEVTEN